jgi:hypothetical protein
MNFYPQIIIPSKLISSEGVESELLCYNEPEVPQYPQEPSISGTWEFIFGVSKHRKRKYEQEKHEYPNKRKQYEIDLKEYQSNKMTTIIEAHKNNSTLISKKYKELFSLNHILVLEDYINKKGVSEDIFKHELISHFGSDIITNKCFNLFGYPDFLLYQIINFNQIIIDIEIDEPYIAESGKVIHYIYEENNGEMTYIDSFRDSTFSDHGILVIRFAEEQIMRYPKQCINYIEKLLNSIKNMTFPYHSIVDNELPKIKRWTEKEAIKLSNQNYRNNYLSKCEIPTSEVRGKIYHIEDFAGYWEDDVSKFSIKTEIDLNNFLPYDSVYLSIVNGRRFSGRVSVDRDLLKMSFDKANGKSLKMYERFIIRLRILSYSEDSFTYKEEDKDNVVEARRIYLAKNQ